MRNTSAFVLSVLLSAAWTFPQRANASTIIVNTLSANNSANDGKCTLREAIISANTNAASGGAANECAAGQSGVEDLIRFSAAAVAQDVHILQGATSTDLADLTFDIRIDGEIDNATGLPHVGYAAHDPVVIIERTGGTRAVLQTSTNPNNHHDITLHGLGLTGASGRGIRFAGDDIVIDDCVIWGNGGSGIRIEDQNASNILISNTWVGVDPSGAVDGHGDTGIDIQQAINVVIEDSVIAGSAGEGIQINGGNNTVSDNDIIRNNLIGTTVNGESCSGTGGNFGNENEAIRIRNGVNNSHVYGNVVGCSGVGSSSNAIGIEIEGGANTNNILIEDNHVGVSPMGANIGNFDNGIRISGSAKNNIILNNTIRFNGTRSTTQLNRNGVAIQDNATDCNRITRNSISNNGKLAISLLNSNSALANEAGDADSTANDGQNYPVVVSVSPASATTLALTYKLDSVVAKGPYIVEFFCNDVNGDVDTATGLTVGEARSYVGSDSNLGNNMNDSVVIDISASSVTCSYLTMTATSANTATACAVWTGPAAIDGTFVEVTGSTSEASITTDISCTDNTAGGTDTNCAAPNKACKMSTQVCVECTVTADCVMGEVCNTTTNFCEGVCDDDGPGDHIDDGCNPITPECNETGIPTCVVCENDQPAGPTNIDGGCNMTTPACKTGAMPVCVVCVVNDDCPAGAHVCDSSGASPVCVQCLVDGDCASDNCDTGTKMCQAACAELGDGTIIDEGCSEPTSECNDTTPGAEFCVVCENDQAAGFIDGGCTGSNPACDTSGAATCVGCLADADCTGGKICDIPTKACVTCADSGSGESVDSGCTEPSSECSVSGMTRTCVVCQDDVAAGSVDGGCSSATPACKASGGPICVACLASADCMGGQICNTSNNACVACLDDQAVGMTDTGCTAGTPDCDTSGATPECVECVQDSECSGGQTCDLNFHECVDPTDEDLDGVNSAEDPDDDNDGVLDTDESGDADDDDVNDRVDLDSDNDGIPDLWENGHQSLDLNHDGRLSGADTGNFVDMDGDGLLAVFEINDSNENTQTLVDAPLDTDVDGISNSLDVDSDDDGVCDLHESVETTSLNSVDSDDDCRIDGFTDSNTNGYHDTRESAHVIPTNTDTHAQPDYLDTDSDDDTINDNIEAHDVNADGDADVLPTDADTNDNGLDDAYDTGAGGNAAALPDHDGDGLPDWRDSDDDDDGNPTRSEAGDDDGDMTPDYLDGISVGISGGSNGCSTNASLATRNAHLVWMLFALLAIAAWRRQQRDSLDY